MKKMIHYSFVAALAVISFTSCKKEDEVAAKTKTELLTTGTWKVSSSMEKVGNGVWEEKIGDYLSCQLDDYLKFNTNNSFEANEGATKCDPADPQSQPGTWAFTNGETQITVFGEVATIEELSATTLKVSSSYDFNGTTYYFRETYTH